MATLDFTVLYHDRGADKGLKNLGKTTEKTGHSFKAMKVAGVAAIAAIGVGVAKFGKDSVKAYVEAEQSQVRLQEAFRKFPKLADTNIGSLNKLNSALALKTKFDDDATASGQAVLAQFNLTGKQITQLTPLLQDYAAKTGKDLPAAASVMGKAFMGNTKALKAIGINYKSTGDAGKDFENIQRLVNEKVGGFAEKEGKSAAGQAAILKNQFGELQESAGKQLLPALLKVGGGLLKLVGWVGTLSPMFSSFKKIAVATFGAFGESIGAGEVSFKSFADFIETHQGDIVGGFVTAGKAVLEFAGGLATGLSAGLRAFGALSDVVGQFTSFSIDQFGLMLKAAVLSMGWMPGIGPKLKDLDGRFTDFANNARDNIYETGDSARALADDVDGKLKPALDKAGRKLDEVGKKEIVKAKTRDAVNRAAIAVQDLGTKSDGSQIKLKKFSDRTKLSASEAKGLNTRLTGVRTALRDQLGSMRNAGAGQESLTKAWKRGKDKLYDEFIQMGLSKKEAKKLADQYGDVPEKVRTKITQPGMKKARDDTKDLDTLINRLNDKKVMISYSTNAEKLALQWRKNQHDAVSPKRARGGVLPGWTPGRDVHMFTSPTAGNLHLSGGEAVMRPEWTRAVGGPAAVDRMNAAARAGRAFADGGVFRDITTTVAGRRSFPNFNGIGNSLASRIGNQLGASIQKELKRLKAASDAADDDGGGPVGKGGYARALSYARRNVGHPYIFGSMWDCSGFMSALHNIILGKGPGGRRYSTPAFHGDHAQGFTRGKRSPFMVGVNPAPGRFGHMAGTLNGVNVESAGGVGVRVGRSARGWNNGLFSWRGGLAGGGVIGDLPFDLLDPRGQRYDPELAAILRARNGLAAGGVVRGGRGGVTTRIGEGRRDELVAPLPKNWENLVRVVERGGRPAPTVIYQVSFPNYVGDKADLKRALVDLNRGGHLDVIKRVA
jgi:hypothetical protein